MTTPRRSAYTLVELLIVVAILGILASLCLPVIQVVRNSAKSVACKNRLKTIGLAMALYAQDNRGLYPIDTNRGLTGLQGWGQAYWNTNAAFMSLYEENWTYNASFNNHWKRMLIDPADPNPAWFANNGLQRFTEYAANAYLVARWNLPRYPYTSMPVRAVTRPAGVLLVSDGADPSLGGGTYGVSAGNGLNTFTEGDIGLLHSLHGGAFNLLFADQHVESRVAAAWPTTSAAGSSGNDFWLKYP